MKWEIDKASIAKNVLEEKTCDTCIAVGTHESIQDWCDFHRQSYHSTCLHWCGSEALRAMTASNAILHARHVTASVKQWKRSKNHNSEEH